MIMMGSFINKIPIRNIDNHASAAQISSIKCLVASQWIVSDLIHQPVIYSTDV
jgi:hypothetical protein